MCGAGQKGASVARVAPAATVAILLGVLTGSLVSAFAGPQTRTVRRTKTRTVIQTREFDTGMGNRAAAQAVALSHGGAQAKIWGFDCWRYDGHAGDWRVTICIAAPGRRLDE